jgi:hypothetical protein
MEKTQQVFEFFSAMKLQLKNLSAKVRLKKNTILIDQNVKNIILNWPLKIEEEFFFRDFIVC